MLPSEMARFQNLQPAIFSAGTLSAPFVVEGILEQWPSRKWTVDSLAQALENRAFRCRLMPREREQKAGPAWEAEGVYVDCRLQEFSAWCRGEAGQDNPLAPFSPQHFSAYIDYKYMAQVFAHLPDMLGDVGWSSLGLTGRDGKDSTLWIGSAGASTPCHYDTYGFNLVAQIQGRKRWVLFPPEQSRDLYPTRIPYEESSVFSQVDLSSPDTVRFPHFTSARPVVVTLEPGQVLYVPRQWWHYVTCTEMAISINTWVDMPEDADSRVQEAVTRLLASSLIPYLSQTAGTQVEELWINPTEELEGASCNVQCLKTALSSVTAYLSTALDGTPRCSDLPPQGHLCDKGTSSASQETRRQTSEGTEGQVSSGKEEPPSDGQDRLRSPAADLSSSDCQPLPHRSADERTDFQTPSNMVRARQSVAEDGRAECKERERCDSGDVRERRGSGDVRERRGCGDERDRCGSGDERERCGCGDVRERRGSGDERDRCGSGDERERRGSGDVRERRGSGDVRERRGCGDERERGDSGDDVQPSGMLSHVGRSLRGVTVRVVDSPFSLSEFKKQEQQKTGSSRQCSSTVTDTQRQGTVSLKRKCVDSENTENTDVQESKASRPSITNSCSAGSQIITRADFSPEWKRMCPGGNNKMTGTDAEKGAQMCPDLCRLGPLMSGSRIFIYAPRSCCLELYIRLLQNRDGAESDDSDLEEEEKEDGKEACAETCSTFRHGGRPVTEEAVLKSVLHPDVVKVIVAKLREQIS